MSSIALHKRLISIAAAAFAALLSTAAPVWAAAVNTGHIEAELVADRTSVAPGQVVHVALRQKIQPGWHTYWRNPGDSGQPVTLDWTLPTGWRAGAIVWPTPQRLKIGPLMDYGYTGEVLLPVAITVPASAVAGRSAVLKAHAAFLVCKDVCVPEDAMLNLDLPVTAAPGAPDPKWASAISGALAAAPTPAGLTAVVTASAASLRLGLVGPAVKGGDFSDAYFYPYDPSTIDQPSPQTVDRGPDGLTLALVPGQAFKSGKPPAMLQGVLAFGGKAYEVSAAPGAPLPGAGGLGPPRPAAGPVQLVTAIGFAFLGGLILNLMPCVFPVLSMKAAAFAGHAHRPKDARVQGLAFMGGTVAAFLALAGALIAARAAGQAVGWGFQLQSPAVVASLALVMLLVALNLSGLFEVGAGLQAAAGQAGASDPGGALGAAITGALAVAVAAPCTAPFMAPAIGYALTQGPIIALSIFAALGLGLAAPFTALAFSPRLLTLLPRPGAWMDGLRKVLAFPMYATAAWLVWVFSQQAGSLGLAGLLAGAVLTGFAGWLYGVAQRRRIEGGRSALTFGTAAAALALALAAALWPQPGVPTSAQAAAAPSAAPGELGSEPFSPTRLAELRAQGRPVFINFTAAWCVTCQVNDKIALSGRRVADAFHKAGVAYLKGDWTNRDAVIAQALAEHGRAGVPLYLMYGSKGGEAEVLPQILTESIVIDAVRKSAPDAAGA
ncbi:MAG TPA: protein-disulfide reductase DsbD domain-containing protein [Caulobacteraceae bacterium]|nr:protein-disulfide reductase DsbD domain-containing protein [Caulobacteraceae bacterium]